MSHDQFHESPPNWRETEEYVRDERKSAKNGLGGLLFVMYSAARIVQVFSRVPGTPGDYMLFATMIGIGLQAYYLVGHEEMHGSVDATDFRLMLAIQIVWFLVGVVSHICRGWHSKGHSRPSDQGSGILRFLTRRSPFLAPAADVLSDLLVGIAIISLLDHLGSQVQAITYAVALAATCVCHVAAWGRRTVMSYRLAYAMRRSSRWHRDVRGRHSL